MPNFVEINPVGFSGGIQLIWQNNIEFGIDILKHITDSFILVEENRKNIGWAGYFFLWIPTTTFAKAALE